MIPVWIRIVEMSLTASLVILFVLPVRWLLRKAPKIFSYVLWAVVLFRLLCPVAVSSSFSLLGFLQVPLKLVWNSGSLAESSSARGAEADSILYQKIEDDRSVPVLEPEGTTLFPVHRDLEQAPKLRGAEERSLSEHTIWLLIGIWLTGMGCLMLYSLCSIWKLRRRLIGAVRLQENIWLADRITSPFVMGVIHPRIYLPSTLSGQEQDYILLHEQTHIRRKDYLIKLLAFLALCIHWFNPLVWLAFFLMVRDMEMSCDESVLYRMGEEIRCDYSASLLNLTVGRNRLISPTPLAFGEGDTGVRIRNILHYKKPAFWLLAVAGLLVAALGISLLCNPKQTDGKEGEAEDGILTEKTMTAKELAGEKFVTEDTKWALRPMIRVNGVLYLDTGKPIPAEIDDSAVLGTVTGSVAVWERPWKDGETNFGREGSKYAYCEDGVVVLLDQEWYFFERNDTTEDAAATDSSDLESQEEGEGKSNDPTDDPMWVPTVEEAIYMAILDHNGQNSKKMQEEPLIRTASWVTLGKSESGQSGEEPDSRNYYIIGQFQEFEVQEPDISDFEPSDSIEPGEHYVVPGSQCLIWAYISLEEREDRYQNTFYRYKADYWQADTKDTASKEAMKGVFPEELLEMALKAEQYQRSLTQECYAQAIRASGLEAFVQTRIDKLLNMVMSPMTSSNPYDYLKAHPEEVEELLAYGEETRQYCDEHLPYCEEHLEEEGMDLRRILLEWLRKELLEEPITNNT